MFESIEKKAFNCLKTIMGNSGKNILAPNIADYVTAENETESFKKLSQRYQSKLANIKWDESKIQSLLGQKGAVYYLKHSIKTRIGSNFTKIIWDGIAKHYQKVGKLPSDTETKIKKYIDGTKQDGGRTKYKDAMDKIHQPLDPNYEINSMKIITCLLIDNLYQSSTCQ